MIKEAGLRRVWATSPARLTAATACARFRDASYVLSQSGFTDPAAETRYGHTVMNLSLGARSEHPLGLDLAYVAGQVLAIGLGVTPDGPAVAYRDALRYLKAVNRDCKGH